MKILVACEYSGKVREAFRKLGHDAWSCDLLPSDDNSPYHIQGDVLAILDDGWDMMIAHPPCTHLAVSGARWFKDKQPEQIEALNFVKELLNAPIQHIALENPISIISSKIRKPDQIIQPWQFGHGETKATCLWLKNLPKLMPTDVVAGRENRVWRLPPSPDRWKLRSETYQGIADAMASQWGRTNQASRGIVVSNYNLKLCPVHNTMTNHLNGVCQKGGCKTAQAEQTVEIIERWQGGDVQYSFDGGPWLTKEQVLNAKITELLVAERMKSEHYWIKYYGDERNFLDGSDGDMPAINELKIHQQLHKDRLAQLKASQPINMEVEND